MSKMHYSNNKFPKIGVLRLQHLLTFDFDGLQLHDLAKLLWFFKLIMTKSNFKKSVMSTFQ